MPPNAPIVTARLAATVPSMPQNTSRASAHSGDFPERPREVISVAAKAGTAFISIFLVRLLTGYLGDAGFGAYAKIVHKDFTCTVDEKNGRITASFEAVLTGHDGKVTQLFNTNFWRIRDGKFQEVYVYFSGENVLV